MRRPALVVLVLAVLLTGAPAVARAGVATPPAGPAALAGIRTPGTAWEHDPATGRLTVTADDTVRGS
ncbi:alpha-lytic protease prodomain-containing protein, partial [Micromonospora chalcea]